MTREDAEKSAWMNSINYIHDAATFPLRLRRSSVRTREMIEGTFPTNSCRVSWTICQPLWDLWKRVIGNTAQDDVTINLPTVTSDDVLLPFPMNRITQALGDDHSLQNYIDYGSLQFEYRRLLLSSSRGVLGATMFAHFGRSDRKGGGAAEPYFLSLGQSENGSFSIPGWKGSLKDQSFTRYLDVRQCL